MTHRVSETASLHLIARLGIPDIIGSVTESPSCSSDDEESDSDLQSEEPRGLSIEEIATIADVPVSKLAGPLRLLTTSGWFDEVREDIFRNNKMSEQLRDGSDAFCWVRSRCVHPVSYSSLILIDRHSEFSARSVTGLAEAITKPAWRHSFNAQHAGCQIGHRSDKHMFELMRNVPGQVYNFTHAVQVGLILPPFTPSAIHSTDDEETSTNITHRHLKVPSWDLSLRISPGRVFRAGQPW